MNEIPSFLYPDREFRPNEITVYLGMKPVDFKDGDRLRIGPGGIEVDHGRTTYIFPLDEYPFSVNHCQPDTLPSENRRLNPVLYGQFNNQQFLKLIPLVIACCSN